MPVGTPFSRWLKDSRKDLDLTQKDLAQAIGCSVVTVKKLESGDLRPSKELSRLLAAFFDIPSEEQPNFLQFARARVGTNEDGLASGGDDRGRPWRAITAPHNLPALLNSFVGRQTEAGTLRNLLVDSDVRLLTLKGAPGVGKTRLALQVAYIVLRYFADGVYFVSLAGVDSPDLVVPAIAATLGVRESGNKGLLESLQAYLQNKQVLLLLDTFEHVLPAGTAVASLLATAPRLKVLVTSREVLNLYGAYDFDLLPLALPPRDRVAEPDELLQYEAVQLFVHRARSAFVGFEPTAENAPVVAGICTRLDGLPLAIELAAGRIRSLPPETISARLREGFDLLAGGPRDLPPRQRALYSAIEWSYNLLAEEEKSLFRAMSVFAGGCRTDAIAEVLGAAAENKHRSSEHTYPSSSTTRTSASDNVPSNLASLVDKSLLRQQAASGAIRYTMLDSLRDYANTKVIESAESQALRVSHADFYLRLAEDAEPQLLRRDQAAWLSRLDEEHDNLRAALEWSLGSQRVEKGPERRREAVLTGVRLSAALWRYWQIRGLFSEGRKWLESALVVLDNGHLAADVAEGVQNEPDALDANRLGKLRVKVLLRAADLVWYQGDREAAGKRFEEGLSIARELGDKDGICASLNMLGTLFEHRGESQQARLLFEDSLTLARELGDRSAEANVLLNLGNIPLRAGNYAEARSYYEQGLRIWRELGDKRGMTMPLINLGVVAREQGDPQAARRLYEESIELSRELGNRRTLGVSLLNLGNILNREGLLEEARALYEEALDMHEEMGDKLGIALVLSNLGNLEARRGNYDEAAPIYKECLAIRNALGYKAGITYCLDGLAEVAMHSGQVPRAARLWAAAEGLRQSLSLAIAPTDRERYEQHWADTRAELGETRWHDEWGRGLAMGVDQAVAYALE
ncbi:MAG: hypothetical protein QOH93_2754 [Chloroflexia bacterium]|jgi:predicted ATPase/transcriptional regulator with XRE-family HTH domain/Tfp pilus assembly protein PilF|nr:hypothetical protein [Chloroflexia bacterium]